MDQFLKKYKQKVEEEIRLLFLPKITQDNLFSILMRNALNCATVHRLTLRKIEIIEYADAEYKVKLNHDMEITFLIGVKTEKEAAIRHEIQDTRFKTLETGKEVANG